MLSPGMLGSGELVDRGLLSGSLRLFVASAVLCRLQPELLRPSTTANAP